MAALTDSEHACSALVAVAAVRGGCWTASADWLSMASMYSKCRCRAHAGRAHGLPSARLGP